MKTLARILPVALAGLLYLGGAPRASSLNGVSGAMPAYYDGQLFLINFKELPPDAERNVLTNNKSVNVIFMSDAGLPDGKEFIAVLDAIQGDGFNPLWLEVQITFNPGVTPRQFTRDDDITDAAANGEITLSSEGEVYRCAVIGAKK